MTKIISFFEHDVFSLIAQNILLFSRLSLFLVYFWFGILKLFGVSSANALVMALLDKTAPAIPFDQFVIILALAEMGIGALFLFPKLSRITFFVMTGHMLTTMLPLLLLPAISWEGFLTPSLEGQYMIKNLVLIALAANLALASKPLTKR